MAFSSISEYTIGIKHYIKSSDVNGSINAGCQTIEEVQPTPTHTLRASAIWCKVNDIKRGDAVLLDGSELDIASVIAVAKYNCDAYVMKTDSIVNVMENSVKVLQDLVSNGCNVYGVNTRFGGSADTRTQDLASLQSALLQLTQAGIMTDEDVTANEAGGAHSMPTAWVRAIMLIRCNTLLRGHSGVRLELVEALLHMLRKGMTPIVPLRGSISASGDLMPLSYIAGMLEGNTDIYVRLSNSRVVRANEALKLASLKPLTLRPKEGLGLVNGTSASTAVGCLAVHESNKLALLAQGLTAMSCEALLGKAESFYPFIAAACPHPGQVECASNILRFLQGSSMVETQEGSDRSKPGLCQDRYALRGASQWLGPQLEDLSSVLSQLTVELNSTSDNPIIDVQSGSVYSGANFIASSVANGMEKARLSLQMVGKLLFALCSELINPTLSRGLPPNLAADDPSLSFTVKGIDISMAAYMSGLAYLANPVTSHVQSAEMNNQSINSLAMISGRFTMQAADITAHMCAAHLYVVCQALDLRVLHMIFLKALQNRVVSVTDPFLDGLASPNKKRFYEKLYKALVHSWDTSASFGLGDRCESLSKVSLLILLEHYTEHKIAIQPTKVKDFEQSLQKIACSTFVEQRDIFFKEPTTKAYLGLASKKLYVFVREELGVPFHQGRIEHPGQGCSATINGRQRRTVGSWVSIIYKAISQDVVWQPLVEIGLIENSKEINR